MAFGRQTTAALVKPLEGAIVRRFTAGATIEAGEVVSLMADGYVDPTNTAAFTGSLVVGVALAGAAAGERVDVVTYGPVTALIDATPAALIYGTDTDGEPGTTVGTKDVIVGFAEAATVLFVRPRMIDLF